MGRKKISESVDLQVVDNSIDELFNLEETRQVKKQIPINIIY